MNFIVHSKSVPNADKGRGQKILRTSYLEAPLGFRETRSVARLRQERK